MLMIANSLTDHDDTPAGDHIILLQNASWADYQRLLEMRGQRRRPRIAYANGELELMSPSRHHERLKSVIGCLIEVWCLERGVEFTPYGEWTLERKRAEKGLEPDECYVFGDDLKPKRPDLAIEVIWTQGRMDKREIYRALKVPELWVWSKGRLTAHALRPNGYEEVSASAVLPGIDLTQLASFLDRPTASQAIRAYRAAVTAGR